MTECSDHAMPGCDQCPRADDGCPQTLQTLSTVCLSMRMDQCSNFYAMCDAAGNLLGDVCNRSGARYDPPMRMYFHTGVYNLI
jgi:hypothetical protein